MVAPQLPEKEDRKCSRSLVVFYFFAGVERKGDIRHWLTALLPKECNLIMHEVDLLRHGEGHDLSVPSNRNKWLEQAKLADVIIATPPCSEFSRVKWANNRGPPPLRNASYPKGFPWLSKANQQKIDLSNCLVQFTWDLANQLSSDKWQLFLAEHPEDLGRMPGQEVFATPASIWRSPEFLRLWDSGWWSGAIRQCDYKAPTPKPTRLLCSDHVFAVMAPNTLPSFNEQGYYTGPVERCTHDHKVSLVRKVGEAGPFRTAEAAAYPSDMCKIMAECIVKAWKNGAPAPTVLSSGEKCAVVTEPTTFPQTEQVTGPPSESESEAPNIEKTLKDKDFKTSCSKDFVEGVDYIKPGWHGTGEPMRTWKSPTVQGRHMADGGGLCSPGRWPAAARCLPPKGDKVRQFLQQGVEDLLRGGPLSAAQHCLSVALGKFTHDPWAESTAKLKTSFRQMVQDEGFVIQEMVWRKGQEIDFPLLKSLAHLLEDPDADSMGEFITGVKLGVDCDLHRTPEVWPPRSKWRLPEFDEADQMSLCENYPSAKDYKEALELDIEEQLALGWMEKMTLKEARSKFLEVAVAPLAVVEDKPGKTRVIHDASNYVLVNHRIRVQDAELCPTALDVQAAVRNDPCLRPPIIALVADVSKAHRRIPVVEEDWGYMACSAEPKPPADLLDSWNILINTVGTYGLGSMSWHWARIGSLVQRISYYCCGLTYLFRFADDFMLLATTGNNEGCYFAILRWLLLMNILGIPLKWPKLKGGLQTDFIGNCYDWRRLTGGLSTNRATWLIDWISGALSNKVISIRELRSVIGRLSFSATLLRYLLPYMGPFYSWVSVLSDSSVRALPVVLRVLLKWIRDRLSERRVVDLSPTVTFMKRSFLADAKAEGNLVVVGGFEFLHEGDLSKSRWFSVRLTPSNAPWAFCKKNQAYRVISSLELFASLLCVMLFGEVQDSKTSAVVCMKGITDNRSNEALIVKSMTTKFPAYLVLLEFTEQIRRRNWTMDLTWVRRDYNQLADDLTNEKWGQFTPSLRIEVDLPSLPWIVLSTGYQEALALYQELEEAKKTRKADNLGRVTSANPRAAKKKKAARLDMPWDEPYS